MGRTFTVEGRGEFPRDMCRRDGCDAADEASRARMGATYENDGDTGRRRITLTTDEAVLTEDRWRSFGWPVVEGGDGAPRTPYRVVASVHPKGAPTGQTHAPIEIERLDVEGPIVGAMADAVKDLVGSEPRLKGQEPYLYNALMGVFASVRWRMEAAFRRNGEIDDISSKIAWNADFDIQVSIS